MKLSVLTFIIIVILSLSCNRSTTEPNDDPIGYQKDIPWPSLANSPWPMLNQNPQAIARGKHVGSLGQIKWEFNFTGVGEDLVGGIVISADSSIYFLTEMYHSAGLYCLDYSGNQRWKVVLGAVHRFATPIITADNNILVLDFNTLKCFNNKGILVWSYNFNNSYFWIETPQIDEYGNIYLLDIQRNLYKISSAGNLEWQITNQSFRGTAGTFGMAIAPNGKTLYIPGGNVTLLAIDLGTKLVKWVYGEQAMMTTPIVDYQGNIYCQLNDRIISLTDNGTLRWEYKYNEFSVNDNKPTFDKKGNIYFTTKDSICSIDYFGNLRWSKLLSKSTDSPLMCDNDGNIYVSFSIGGLSMLKYNNTGEKISEINFNTTGQLYSSPILSIDNTIIFPTEKKIFAIK